MRAMINKRLQHDPYDNNAHKDICTKRTKLIQGWRSTDRTVLGCIQEIRSFVLGNSE